MAGEREQVAALQSIYELARLEIRDALRLVDPGDAAAIADVIVTYVPVIADRYGLSASVLAAEWYEDMRDAAGVRGSFGAVLADPPDLGRYTSMAGWASDRDAVEALVAGGVQRIIANMHRETIMRSSFFDPQAEGWARFATGATTCSFCYLTITRGGVYTQETAKFASHDSCDCQAGVIWRGRAGAGQVDTYRKSARRRSEGQTDADNERARAWIAENL